MSCFINQDYVFSLMELTQFLLNCFQSVPPLPEIRTHCMTDNLWKSPQNSSVSFHETWSKDDHPSATTFMAWEDIYGLMSYRQTSDITRTLVANQNCWSRRCSWSIACRRCSNCIFILDLTLTSMAWLGNDNCKTRRETFQFWDLLWRIFGLTVILR